MTEQSVAQRVEARTKALNRFLCDNMDDVDFNVYSARLETLRAALAADAVPVAQPAPTAQAELSDDAKDAARYRWLRDSDDAFDALWLHTYRLIDADADQFDKAIDAALARHAGEGEKHDK